MYRRIIKGTIGVGFLAFSAYAFNGFHEALPEYQSNKKEISTVFTGIDTELTDLLESNKETSVVEDLDSLKKFYTPKGDLEIDRLTKITKISLEIPDQTTRNENLLYVQDEIRGLGNDAYSIDNKMIKICKYGRVLAVIGGLIGISLLYEAFKKSKQTNPAQ